MAGSASGTAGSRPYPGRRTLASRFRTRYPAARSPLVRPSRYGVPVDEADWEQRVAAAWESFGRLDEAQFLALIEELAAELPADSGIGLFERASSMDATGHADMAVPLYRQ